MVVSHWALKDRKLLHCMIMFLAIALALHICGCRVLYPLGNIIYNLSFTSKSFFNYYYYYYHHHLYFYCTIAMSLHVLMIQMHSCTFKCHRQAWTSPFDWWDNSTWHFTYSCQGERYANICFFYISVTMIFVRIVMVVTFYIIKNRL